MNDSNSARVTPTCISEELAERLHAAGKKVENQAKVRREREVKGSHLLEPMMTMAKELGGLTIEDKSGFHKITGAAGKDKALYVARKGGRVDVSGFTIESECVIQISEEDAKAKHLGKVRGQINFEKDDEAVKAAFRLCLEQLNVPAVKPEKKAKKAAQPAPAAEDQFEATPSTEQPVATDQPEQPKPTEQDPA